MGTISWWKFILEKGYCLWVSWFGGYVKITEQCTACPIGPVNQRIILWIDWFLIMRDGHNMLILRGRHFFCLVICWWWEADTISWLWEADTVSWSHSLHKMAYNLAHSFYILLYQPRTVSASSNNCIVSKQTLG